ncbi:phosphomevalonate kinase [Malaya genurostris]|uniref:phosphomevalonate kinase n=1 Tax=Malaya genurostris TaxID=325434 RepID=UPI0026F3A201|nr:phosphomevalonate kinase [Malaya genurostris]XP_058442926.1 phosphomevalonate kinase [Malaya genurostris]XP_058442927.1 phosphomevalonate kinase [Malaya genurostris]
MSNIPRSVLLCSGKRKTGKDFLTERLLQRLSADRAQIIRISEPIKRSWAEKLGLNLNELLSDGPYKEKYRKEMIEWSDQQRAEDYGFFCRQACMEVNKEICIVSDVRRKSDIRYFKELFGSKVKTVRIEATEETRKKRGWHFQEGVDNVQSECDLDNMTDWDLLITNDCGTDVEEALNKIITIL